MQRNSSFNHSFYRETEDIMSVVKELIRTEENGKLSFGDYTLAEKTKKEDNFLMQQKL